MKHINVYEIEDSDLNEYVTSLGRQDPDVTCDNDVAGDDVRKASPYGHVELAVQHAVNSKVTPPGDWHVLCIWS